jgi:hypothetical protein
MKPIHKGDFQQSGAGEKKYEATLESEKPEAVLFLQPFPQHCRILCGFNPRTVPVPVLQF